MSHAIQALRSRGMLAALTSPNIGATLDNLLQLTSNVESSSNKLVHQSPAIYCGFDPTASSLHVGNLLQGIALRHFQQSGIRPILVIGGATGQIGDPSGKSEERILLSEEEVNVNAQKMLKTLHPVLDFECPKTGAIVCNNVDWHGKMSAIEWMRDIGRHFRVNAMLSRESVKQRLESDQGISFLEFSYQLFQAYDFLYLLKKYNCVAQLGGSDQWGNIASGCDLIRKTEGKEAFGVTLSLLTTAAGEKYGKSAGNAIWLDSNKTSAFEFYQYFLRSEDSDVEQLLKSFTFLDLAEIQEIVKSHQGAPHKRIAQKILAENVTKLVHGSNGLDKAVAATMTLFAGDNDTSSLSVAEILKFADESVKVLPRNLALGKSLVDIMVQIQVAPSKAECRRLIKGGGVYIESQRVLNDHFVISNQHLKDDQLLILRIGKRKKIVVHLQ